MIKIVVLGAGNLASHLCKAFIASKKISIIQVYSRTVNSLKSIPSSIILTTKISELKEADIYILAIPDDAIAGFSEALPFQDKLVVHTSGSVALKKLSNKNRKGVFYPLQTFSKDSEVDFSEIPICLEAENSSDIELLKEMGKAISKNVQLINSEEREKLHLAAVFVNNFVNFLYQAGSDLLSENKLSFDLLKPLIKETANKISKLNPSEAQTGPARRNDQLTIEKQLHLLKDNEYKALYKLFTRAIQKRH